MAASTSGPSNGARASTARRRTAGRSVVAASTAGRPAASPMAPSAATAASRHSGSSCPVTTGPGRATMPGSGGTRSPDAQAAASTTRGSSSARADRQRGRLVAGPGGAQLGGAGPHGGGGVGQARGQVVRGQSAAAGQRAEGGGPHRRGRVGEERPGSRHVAAVAGDGGLAPPGDVVGYLARHRRITGETTD